MILNSPIFFSFWEKSVEEEYDLLPKAQRRKNSRHKKTAGRSFLPRHTKHLSNILGSFVMNRRGYCHLSLKLDGKITPCIKLLHHVSCQTSIHMQYLKYRMWSTSKVYYFTRWLMSPIKSRFQLQSDFGQFCAGILCKRQFFFGRLQASRQTHLHDFYLCVTFPPFEYLAPFVVRNANRALRILLEASCDGVHRMN